MFQLKTNRPLANRCMFPTTSDPPPTTWTCSYGTPCKHTDITENVTFPQTTHADGNNTNHMKPHDECYRRKPNQYIDMSSKFSLNYFNSLVFFCVFVLFCFSLFCILPFPLCFDNVGPSTLLMKLFFLIGWKTTASDILSHENTS